MQGIAVNVFGLERGVYPYRISKEEGVHVDLLLLGDGEKQHFCLIKSLSRLLSSQVNSHQDEKVFCRRCLNPFPCEKKLEEHSEWCKKKDFVKIQMETRTLKFKNWKRKEKVPFVIYADFECLNEKVDFPLELGKTKSY